jgi:HEAT repeat protein
MLDQQDAAVAGLLRSALEKIRQADAARVETFVLMIGQSAGREYALHQLARLGPIAIAAAPVLITVLQDERPMHRYLAIEALSAIGAGGERSIVALTPLLHDPDPIVRESAADALAAIDGRSPALSNGAGESPRVKL